MLPRGRLLGPTCGPPSASTARRSTFPWCRRVDSHFPPRAICPDQGPICDRAPQPRLSPSNTLPDASSLHCAANGQLRESTSFTRSPRSPPSRETLLRCLSTHSIFGRARPRAGNASNANGINCIPRTARAGSPSKGRANRNGTRRRCRSGCWTGLRNRLDLLTRHEAGRHRFARSACRTASRHV